eukprot:scaffold1395_cov397-Prasinococcus_capsulatus_cf.AAC.7
MEKSPPSSKSTKERATSPRESLTPRLRLGSLAGVGSASAPTPGTAKLSPTSRLPSALSGGGAARASPNRLACAEGSAKPRARTGVGKPKPGAEAGRKLKGERTTASTDKWQSVVLVPSENLLVWVPIAVDEGNANAAAEGESVGTLTGDAKLSKDLAERLQQRERQKEALQMLRQKVRTSQKQDEPQPKRRETLSATMTGQSSQRSSRARDVGSTVKKEGAASGGGSRSRNAVDTGLRLREEYDDDADDHVQDGVGGDGVADRFNLKQYYPTTLPFICPKELIASQKHLSLREPQEINDKTNGEAAMDLDAPEEAEQHPLGESDSCDRGMRPTADVLGLLQPTIPEQMIVFQLPQVLPYESAEKRASNARSLSGGALDAPHAELTKPGPTLLKDLPEGKLGKLLVYESGKVKLQLGDTLLDVSMGIPCSFSEQIVAMNIDDAEANFLGDVTHHVVCAPDIEALALDKESTND